MRLAKSIRNHCLTQKCRDQAAEAYLEIMLEFNPAFDKNTFRSIAGGTVDDDWKTMKYEEAFQKRRDQEAKYPRARDQKKLEKEPDDV